MALKAEWKIFIKEMNKKGDKIEAYLKAYPNTKSRKSAATSAERLLKNAEINKLLKINPDIQQKAQEKLVEELKEELKMEVMESTEKRNVLRQLVFGELLIEEHYIRKDGTVGKYMRKANAAEIANAIQIDNRMSGDDAPTKHEVKDTTDISTIYKKAMLSKDAYQKAAEEGK